MPSGYTHKIQDGTMTSFKDFAMRCSQAFLIHLRDSDFVSRDIPKREFSDYYKNKIDETNEEINRIKSMSIKEAKKEITKLNKELKKQNKEHEIKLKKERARYEKMLQKVEEWNPPTKEYYGIKGFMKEQIQSSIEHDCYPWTQELIGSTPYDWKEAKLNKLASDLEYYQNEYKKEEQRCNDTNKWIDDFVSSLE